MRLLIVIVSFLCCSSMSAQTQNVRCTYAATHVISDAVKNIEDAQIREMVMERFKNDKKSYCMIYADGKYSFSEYNGQENTEIKTVGGTNSIFIDTQKDSIIAQKSIIDKEFLIKDTYKPTEWTLTKDQKTINGKVCTKATAKGNLPVTAWFTTEISLGVGPLGYLGLPGIIMQLDTPTYSYVLQEIVDLAEVPTYEIPKGGKVVTQAEFDKLEAEKIKERGVQPGSVKIIRL